MSTNSTEGQHRSLTLPSMRPSRAPRACCHSYPGRVPRPASVALTEAPGSLHTRAWTGPGAPTAPTIVLLHGIVSSRYLVPTARRLAGSCKVVAPDLPGFGRTAATGRPMRVAEMADLVAAWMAASGLEDSTVVGHSVGAQTAASLAAHHPGAVRKLVLVGPTVDQDARNVTAQIGRWLVNAPTEPPAFNALAAYELAEIGPTRMLRCLRRAVEHAIEDNLGDISCPVLLVRGAGDRVAPQGWLQELQRRLRGSDLVVLAGAAHTVVYSHPVQLARLIVDFAASGAT